MLEEQLQNLEISSSEQSESERSSEGESDSDNIDMFQFDGSTSSDCQCTDSDNCECNVTIDEENDLYRALLNTKDNIARKVIQEKLNQKREEPNNKGKNKIDPSLHTSIERNTAQFRVKTIDEVTNMASVSNAIRDLRNRVKHLEDLVNIEYQHEWKEPTSPFKHEEPESSSLLNSVVVQTTTIRMKVIIDGRNLILNTLIDTGAGMNAIKPEFVPYHVRQTSRIPSVRTITGTEEISSEAPIVLCLNKAGTETMQVSCILHDGLTAYLSSALLLSLQ